MPIQRVLIFHPEWSVRQELGHAVRRSVPSISALHESDSLARVPELVRHLLPDVVLLDLVESRDLALLVCRQLRREGQKVVGLYNPLLQSSRDVQFFRDAVRAGVSDFLPLPPSDRELAEAFAELQPEAAPLANPRRGRVVAFLPAPGGSGATTLAVNAALLAVRSGGAAKLVLCDADLQFGSMAEHLGLSPDRDLFDLARDLDSGAALPAYLTSFADSELRLLASPRSLARAAEISPETLARILIQLEQRFELVFVDLAPSLDLATLSVLDLASTIWVVTEPALPRLSAASRLLEALDSLGLGKDRVRLVLNKVGAFDGALTEATVAQRLGRAVRHSLPFDRSIPLAAHRGAPSALTLPRGAFGEALAAISQESVRREGGVVQKARA